MEGMTEAEAAMAIGTNLGLILAYVVKMPVILSGPVGALLGLGGFFFGRRYERKWELKQAKKSAEVITE